MEKQDYAVPAIVTAFILIIIITRSVDPKIPLGDAIVAIATLAGAFIGAWGAFSLQSKKEALKKTEEERATANKTILMLFDMRNRLTLYKRDVLNPAIETGVPWIAMKPTIQFQDEVKLPAEGLLFVLDTDNVQLYADLMIEVQRFNVVMQMINKLSTILSEEFQPTMQSLGYTNGINGIYPVVVETEIGPHLASRMKGLTSDIISNVTDNIASIDCVYEKFRAAMVNNFPDKKILGVTFK
ncbi:hypothetical protein HXX01_05015 [Candidatus Nomurabacteria bacterium]|nr:hypothetical protein [Candidatus Nomurabacteria bacterium]